jgi:hypothetical protein
MATDKAYVQHLVRGGELLRADKIDEARAELEQANTLKPGDGKILNLLGLVYFRLGLYPEALSIYGELVKRQPGDASLRLNLGLVHLKQGAVDDAIAELLVARKLDPDQMRTVGYLGLAYARKGQYAEAKEAFHLAGQDELAKEMEGLLLGSATAPVTAEAPEAIPDETSGPVLDPSDIGAVEDEGLASSISGGGIVNELADLGVVSEAVRAADVSFSGLHRIPPPPPMFRSPAADLPAPIPGVQTVSSFATAQLIRPDDGDVPLEVVRDALIVRVRGRLMSRTVGVVLTGGELAFEPATKRIRGKVTDEPFGSEEQPMFYVMGSGHLVVFPFGQCFAAMQLTDDVMYIREDLVFAFEEGLGWENGHVPASKIPVLQLRGEGYCAIRTPRPLMTVKLAPEGTLHVAAKVLAGWIGRVVPRATPPAAGANAELFVECTGEGVVLVEEPADEA